MEENLEQNKDVDKEMPVVDNKLNPEEIKFVAGAKVKN